MYEIQVIHIRSEQIAHMREQRHNSKKDFYKTEDFDIEIFL